MVFKYFKLCGQVSVLLFHDENRILTAKTQPPAPIGRRLRLESRRLRDEKVIEITRSNPTAQIEIVRLVLISDRPLIILAINFDCLKIKNKEEKNYMLLIWIILALKI